jgi:uncharacterized protein
MSFHCSCFIVAAASLILLLGCDKAQEERRASGFAEAESHAASRAQALSAGRCCHEPPARADMVQRTSGITAKSSVPPTEPPRAFTDRATAGVVPILFSAPETTDHRLPGDLVNVLANDKLRVLPILGSGPLQTIDDLLRLPGIDVGVVQVDAPESLTAETRSSVRKRLRYIARLYNEEVHVLATRDIHDLRHLDGRRVALGPSGSATSLTSRRVFEKLGIQPIIAELDHIAALDRLRSGGLDAVLLVAPRPARLISEFKADERFHLVSIDYQGELAELYLPGKLEPTDYPNLIRGTEPVQTIAVGTVLAVVDWPKGTKGYRRAVRLATALYSRFGELHGPGRHPKWADVSPAAMAPGWQLFKPAEDWARRESESKKNQASGL